MEEYSCSSQTQVLVLTRNSSIPVNHCKLRQMKTSHTIQAHGVCTVCGSLHQCTVACVPQCSERDILKS